jgi:3-polyprenyl-4-hydroxybenzoate decarboxylase
MVASKPGDNREYEPEENRKDVDRFSDFWKLYPRKVGKLAAEKAWARLKPADRQAVLDDLPRRTASRAWTKDGGEFIQHPATYLNGRRWEDELEPAQSHGNAGVDYSKGFHQ